MRWRLTPIGKSDLRIATAAMGIRVRLQAPLNPTYGMATEVGVSVRLETAPTGALTDVTYVGLRHTEISIDQANEQ